VKRIRTRRKRARTSSRRPRQITPATRLQVLAEAGYMCGNPRCKHILTLELHHIEWVRDGGGNDVANLIALCSNCHDLHTKGHIPRRAIEAWKQMLMLVSSSLDRDSMDLLLFLHGFQKKSLDVERQWDEWRRTKDSERQALEASDDTTQRQLREHEEKWTATEPPRGGTSPLQVTGDGLLRLVRLIRTGLVEEGPQRSEVSDGMWHYYWQPALTQTGQTLAEAFISGDVDAFRALLVGTHQGKYDGA
jgi:hypothetical protein